MHSNIQKYAEKKIYFKLKTMKLQNILSEKI